MKILKTSILQSCFSVFYIFKENNQIKQVDILWQMMLSKNINNQDSFISVLRAGTLFVGPFILTIGKRGLYSGDMQ